MNTSRFVEREIVKKDLGGGDWVRVYIRLAYGDRQAVFGDLANDAARIGPMLGPDEELDPAKLPIDLGSINVHILRRAIVEWGGPGFCSQKPHPHDGSCTPRPITAENIAELDETGEEILEWLEQQRGSARSRPGFTKRRSQSSSTERRAGRTRKGSRTSK